MSEPKVTLKDIHDLNEKIKNAVRASTTYFGATGKVHEELPWSNLLAFFFEPDEERLGPFVLDAFLHVAGVTEWCGKTKKDVRVEREVPIKGGRMDIVVSWASGKARFAIAIENKIHAPLKNPLRLYEKYLDEHYPNNSYRAFILSPDGTEASDNSGFTAITYSCLATEIRKRLEALKGKKGKWEYMLEDFIDTIDANLNCNSVVEQEVEESYRKLNEQIDLLNEEVRNSAPNKQWKRRHITEDGRCSLGFDFQDDFQDFRVGIYLEDDFVYNCFSRKGKDISKVLELLKKLLKKKKKDDYLREGEGGVIPHSANGSKTMESRRKDVLTFLEEFLPVVEEAIKSSRGGKKGPKHS